MKKAELQQCRRIVQDYDEKLQFLDHEEFWVIVKKQDVPEETIKLLRSAYHRVAAWKEDGKIPRSTFLMRKETLRLAENGYIPIIFSFIDIPSHRIREILVASEEGEQYRSFYFRKPNPIEQAHKLAWEVFQYYDLENSETAKERQYKNELAQDQSRETRRLFGEKA
jgi:hypothetical protein